MEKSQIATLHRRAWLAFYHYVEKRIDDEVELPVQVLDFLSTLARWCQESAWFRMRLGHAALACLVCESYDAYLRIHSEPRRLVYRRTTKELALYTGPQLLTTVRFELDLGVLEPPERYIDEHTGLRLARTTLTAAEALANIH